MRARDARRLSRFAHFVTRPRFECAAGNHPGKLSGQASVEAIARGGFFR